MTEMTQLLIRLFIKDENTEDKNVRLKYGILAGCVGIFANLLLTIIKIITGMLTGAISITADAMNNLSDALSSIVTLVGFRMSGKPADSEHPFGHGRIEYLTGFVVSVAIIAIALNLMKTSAVQIMTGTVPYVNRYTAVILSAAILVKAWLSGFYYHISRMISSPAMRASGRDSLMDCLTTGVSLVSVLCLLVTGINIDALAGFLVSFVVLWSGITAARETLEPVIGKAPDPELVDQIRAAALQNEAVINVHDIYVHEYGPGTRIVSMHVEMSSALSLIEAHKHIHHIETELRRSRLADQVTIHVDPVDFNDPERTKEMELTETVLYNISPELSMHDFMIIPGKEGKRTIAFDVVVPYSSSLNDQDLTEKILRALPKDPDTEYEIEIDRGDYRTVSGSRFPVL